MKTTCPDSTTLAAELFAAFGKASPRAPGQKLMFTGVGDNDVYNISPPFSLGGRELIVGRVEQRTAWADSHLMLFEEQDDVWAPIKGTPILKLEDGFTARLGDEIILGGVESWHVPLSEEFPEGVDFRTVFHRGRDLASLTKFAVGPRHMKDIRLVELASGKIGVLTRPQGQIGGRGKIGYLELDSLDELTPERLLEAKIFENQFSDEIKGGSNQLHLLPDGRLGVVGHLAIDDAAGNHHYAAMTFIIDTATLTTTPIKLLATRADFPPGPAKYDVLQDVVFPGGLVRHGDGTATLYAGLNDVEAGSLLVADPFF